MELLQMQTATKELPLSNKTIFKGLLYNFSDLFNRKIAPGQSFIPEQESIEGSQFYKKQVELAGTGIRAKATVLHVVETGVMINRDPVISITIRFYNLKKVLQEITANTVVPYISIPKIADNVTIAYKANNPGIVAVL